MVVEESRILQVSIFSTLQRKFSLVSQGIALDGRGGTLEETYSAYSPSQNLAEAPAECVARGGGATVLGPLSIN